MSHKKPSKPNILLAVSGNTPQIVTETLYALMVTRKPAVPISEVRILTTAKGKEIAWRALGGRDGAIARFRRDYGFSSANFVFTEENIFVFKYSGGEALEDVRTTDDNRRIQTQILRYIRELASDETVVLHCSMGGGRRTMSAFLMLAMTMFGREGDTLTHVLVDQRFESNPDFFFPPRRSENFAVRLSNGRLAVVETREAKIDLAEIPFVRLRELYLEKLGNDQIDDDQLREIAQAKIATSGKAPPRLEISQQQGTARFDGQPVDLVGVDLALFIYYALLKKDKCVRADLDACTNCDDCYIRLYDIEPGKFSDHYRRTARYSKEATKEKIARWKVKWDKGPPFGMPNHTTINKKVRGLSEDLMVRSRHSHRGYYGIRLDKNRIDVS